MRSFNGSTPTQQQGALPQDLQRVRGTVLGSGAHGTVTLAIWKGSSPVALKLLRCAATWPL